MTRKAGIFPTERGTLEAGQENVGKMPALRVIVETQHLEHAEED